MKPKLLSALLCLTLLALFSGLLTMRVAASASATLAVYVKRGDSGTAVLLHTYTQSEMQTLATSTQYYTGIDSMPCVVQGKGTGVLLNTLVNNLKNYDSGVSFGSGGSIRLAATDGVTATFQYSYLFGATRYCYPDLYTSSDDGSILGGTGDATPVDPMLCVTSYQSRSLDTNIQTRQVIDSQTMDTSMSYRFCFGLLPSDVTNQTITASKFLYWVYRIDITLPVAAPAITSFTPDSGGAGTSVTIAGSNLDGATAVSFGGITAQSYTVNSGTQITAVVGNGASGSVTVTTPGGTATSSSSFTFISAPAITSFTPGTGGAGTSMTIIGSNMGGATAVSFGGTAARSFTVNSSTQITALVGDGTSGYITVTTPGGTAISSSNFTFIQAPVITSFTPTSGVSGTVVVISGNNLSGTYAVTFGGTAAQSFTITSNTQITALVGNGTSGPVTVTAPGGSAASSSSFYFGLPPAITSFTPASGGTGTSVTITGNYFNGATSVTFGGTASDDFTVNSNTQITAIVGNGTSGALIVTTPAGSATAGGNFTFVPVPIITAFTPVSGGSGASVTITGNNLNGATAVSFGGTAAKNFTVNSNTQITAVVGNGDAGAITVTTPGGIATSSSNFIFVPAPAISSFTPASGGSGATVTITGSNLSGATAVNFGGTAARSFSVDSNTQITAIIGNGASGAVVVTTPGGNGASSTSFSFIALTLTEVPVVSSFTPVTGGSGTSVIITGNNLNGTTAVNFGGVTARSFSVNSDTQITAVVGDGASGAISVTTPGGTAIGSDKFSFASVPVITTSILPPTPTDGIPETSPVPSDTGNQVIPPPISSSSETSNDVADADQPPAFIFVGMGVLVAGILAAFYLFRKNRVVTSPGRNREHVSPSQVSNAVEKAPPKKIFVMPLEKSRQDNPHRSDNKAGDEQIIELGIEITFNDAPDSASGDLPAKIVLKGDSITTDGKTVQINIIKNVNKKDAG